jgi:hypothetical protein
MLNNKQKNNHYKYTKIMYTPIAAAVIYGNGINVGFHFDVESLKDLVKTSIISVNRTLVYFARSKNKKKGEKYIALKMSKHQLTNEIGISMEIIEKSILLTVKDEDIRFDKETRQSIKKLFTKVDKLLHKLGQCDSDFCTDYSTQRARPSKEVMEFIQKKW